MQSKLALVGQLSCILLQVALAGCHPSELKSNLRNAGEDSMDDQLDGLDLAKLDGKQVRLQGTAVDAKAGAVLQLAGGEVVYIEALDYWEDRLIGNHVVANGVLACGRQSRTLKPMRREK